MEQSTISQVTFTEAALKELNRILNTETIPENYFLRVGVKGGGCSGMSYMLGFDEITEKDIQFEFDDVKVIMEKAHGMYLMGMEVDYHDGLNNRGFVFNNPNASDSCGCGSSFAV